MKNISVAFLLLVTLSASLSSINSVVAARDYGAGAAAAATSMPSVQTMTATMKNPVGNMPVGAANGNGMYNGNGGFIPMPATTSSSSSSSGGANAATSTTTSSYTSTGSAAMSSQKTGLDRFIMEEHKDVRNLSVAGLYWAIAGLLILIGFLTLTFFRQLVSSQAIACFKTLVAWTASIWALLTILFITPVIVLAFTLPGFRGMSNCDDMDSSCMDRLYMSQGRDVHTLALSGIWIAFFGYLFALGLLFAAFIDSLQCITRNCTTVIASYWTLVGIAIGIFIIGCVIIALLL